MIDYAKQVDAMLKREAEIEERLTCPRCHGERIDATRRYCAPCILSFQIKKLKTTKQKGSSTK